MRGERTMKKAKNAKQEKYAIDFFKAFKLKKPTCGLVERIVSPKGNRRETSEGYEYSFKTDTSISSVYKHEPMLLYPGIYRVVDITPIDEKMTWNGYLFVVENDGTVYPVAEYVNYRNTSWVKKSIPLLKKYFEGKSLEEIEITKLKNSSPHKTLSWTTAAK